MRNADQVAAVLLLRGAVPRNELPELQAEATRDAVRSRLEPLGFELVDSHYAGAYGLRVFKDALIQDDPELLLNQGLGVDAMTMLTILWCKLALPSRIVEDTGKVRGQDHLTVEAQRNARAENVPRVHVEALIKEFADKFPKREHVQALLGRLKGMGFVQIRSQYVYAGPNLEIAVNGDRMKTFVESSLAELKARVDAIRDQAHETTEDKVHAWLLTQKGPVRRTAIQQALGLAEPTVIEALRILREEGRARMRDTGWKATYEAAESEKSPTEPAEES